MATKPLVQVNGVLTENVPNTTSAGSADAGKLVALNASGAVDQTMMPAGIGPDIQQMPASENLSAGAMVNVWTNAGAANARNADGSVSGKYADGFVLAAVTSGATATVYFPGNLNTSLTGLTPGSSYFLSSSTPGGVSTTAPSGSGQSVQRVGKAVTATTLAMQSHPAIAVA